MLKVRQALLCGIVALTAAWSSPQVTVVRAQDPMGLGYGYLFGYGAMNTPGIRSFVPAPPYFALHPPVYYGKRYTRPYGDSPFASWPQLRSTPSYHMRPAAPHAQLLLNPLAPCCNQGGNAGEAITPVVQSMAPQSAAQVQPLVIDNPYYQAAVAGRLVTAEESGVETE
jgi:hypothetical protein